MWHCDDWSANTRWDRPIITWRKVISRDQQPLGIYGDWRKNVTQWKQSINISDTNLLVLTGALTLGSGICQESFYLVCSVRTCVKVRVSVFRVSLICLKTHIIEFYNDSGQNKQNRYVGFT